MKIKLSKSQWQLIGRKTGWMKMASDESTEKVRNAIKNSKTLMPDYWNKTLNQRSAKSSMVAGSRYDMDAASIEKALLNATWKPFSSPSIKGAEGFVTNLPGYLGMISLSKLSPNDTVTLDDRKGTGYFSVICNESVGDPVDYTVIIVGKEGENDVVFTFFPGDPTPMKGIPANPEENGKQITVKEALDRGFEFAKVK